MARFRSLWLFIVLAALGLTASARASEPSPRGPMGAGRRTFVAVGPTSEGDLARLRAALSTLTGVLRVEVRPQPRGAVVLIEGESSSLTSAAARSAGYTLRPAPTRSFAAAGSASEANRIRLRETLLRIEGVERVELGPLAGGAALRVTGIAGGREIDTAARTAGFTLRQVGGYVAAGSSAPRDLDRLRAALAKTDGVEQVELQGLDGGATLLIYGSAGDEELARAGKSAGYQVWPLGGASGPREYRIAGPPDLLRLRELLASVEGIGDLQFRRTPDGPRLVIDGGRARPERVVAAARAGGVALTPVEEPVLLPTLAPVAGRGTPPDYDERVLEDQAKPGVPAPDFELVGPDGVKPVRLSDFRGRRPVVLLFGSCT